MQGRGRELLRKAPQLAPAGDRRFIVEKHAVRIAALASTERHRDDLAGLGVIAEPGRVRHPNELILYQGSVRLERFGHDRSQLGGIRSISYDQKLTIDETVSVPRRGL